MMGESWDVVIIGGGPAALAAALYAARGELKTLVLERQALGGQVAQTDIIDNYPGFPEGISGPDLTERMSAQAQRFGADIRTEEVTHIEVDGKRRITTTAKRTYESPVVILAMGSDPRHLGVPGENELRGRGVSYCGTCDAPFFRDKKVVVVGGGDSALKEGLFIAKFASEVTIVHRRQGLRAEKIYQTRAHANPKITFVLDTIVKEILGANAVEGVEVCNVKNDEVNRIDCQGVFIFIGHVPNTGFLGNLYGDRAGGHLPTDRDMMTSVPGIYAVGDVREYSYRQVATAVGEGTTAAMAADHYINHLHEA
jgi:thioredoxin reductase (NADPH)